MRKCWGSAFTGLFLCLGASTLWAQAPPTAHSASATVTPSADQASPTDSLTPTETPSVGETAAATETPSPEVTETPFVPHWSGQVGYTYSNQPSAGGQGQIQNQVGLTGTYNFTEDGHYMALGIIGGQQLVNQANTNFGEITLEGGLGFDFFNPALELTAEQGAQALSSFGSVLTLAFKPWDALTLSLIGGGEFKATRGPLLPKARTRSTRSTNTTTTGKARFRWNPGIS